MNDTGKRPNPDDPNALVVRHWVDAPVQRVWDAYMNPDTFCRFFAPEGLSIPRESVVIEPWVGGKFECTMVFDESGEESPNTGVIVEFDPPHRYVGAEDMWGGFLSSWDFTDEDGGTLITVVQTGLPPELAGSPEVLEAFRSSYRKLGSVLGVRTENRDRTP